MFAFQWYWNKIKWSCFTKWPVLPKDTPSTRLTFLLSKARMNLRGRDAGTPKSLGSNTTDSKDQWGPSSAEAVALWYSGTFSMTSMSETRLVSRQYFLWVTYLSSLIPFWLPILLKGWQIGPRRNLKWRAFLFDSLFNLLVRLHWPLAEECTSSVHPQSLARLEWFGTRIKNTMGKSFWHNPKWEWVLVQLETEILKSRFGFLDDVFVLGTSACVCCTTETFSLCPKLRCLGNCMVHCKSALAPSYSDHPTHMWTQRELWRALVSCAQLTEETEQPSPSSWQPQHSKTKLWCCETFGV